MDERTSTRHRVLAAVAGINALAAWGGAAGLIAGFLSIGGELEARLPYQSPVLGGLALAVLVAVPLTALAVLAWIGDPRTPVAATAVGVVLIGWIVVQLAFLRSVSFFHPFYLGVGLGLAIWGRRAGRADLAAPGRADVAGAA